jgi:N-hydroxyarylamine O-acetyltransferase
MLMEARLGEAWAPVYLVTPDRQLHVDFELSNWFSSTHPSSHFRHNLLVAKTTPEARYGLLFNRFTIRRPNGEQERRELSAEEIEAVLGDVFGLEVEPAWRPIIERAALGAP